tara:strand:- start:160 stop:324 length:165 start_codon:yes stop_codon:yes gene_type:complete
MQASIDALAKASLLNVQILSTLREKNLSVTLISKDISNLVAKKRLKQLENKILI